MSLLGLTKQSLQPYPLLRIHLGSSLIGATFSTSTGEDFLWKKWDNLWYRESLSWEIRRKSNSAVPSVGISGSEVYVNVATKFLSAKCSLRGS